jgi:alkanesulfonate monooxygenase SsuD/methylene tetrahydromethanopterin reductase-like flavin-dependent oxidoreductase (luciferase family)
VRHARLAEALGIIRQLWTGAVVTYEGTYFTVHDAKLFTRPGTPPDILVSGFGPEATRLAAQIGQGWISASPDAEGMKTYRDAGGGAELVPGSCRPPVIRGCPCRIAAFRPPGSCRAGPGQAGEAGRCGRPGSRLPR